MAQTAAMLVLSPIFEADLQPEQYAYRPGRDANDAVRRVHRLLTTGHREVVDADLSDYFGHIPHCELLQSIARRVSDGRLLCWVKAWLEMAVEKDDGQGGRRLTNRARRERRGTPQGSPVSPLFSNIYMRRFILGWKVLGHAQRFEAEIVNYADDLAVLGKAPAAEMLAAADALMKRLKLTMNAEKTRCCRLPEDSMTFLWGAPGFLGHGLRENPMSPGGGGMVRSRQVKGAGSAPTEGARRATGVGADSAAMGSGALAPGQRWSASRKRDVVLRLLRGEPLASVSREVGVEVYRLERWKARALAGLELGLKEQAGEPLAAELDAAKRHIGELSMDNELLRSRARAAERRLPLATRRSRR